jgi:hypothetical protein
MASGSRSELRLMAALVLLDDPGPLSNVLTKEQAEEMERLGLGKVARIPIKPKEDA